MSVYPKLSLMGRGMTDQLHMHVTPHGDNLIGMPMTSAVKCTELTGAGVLDRKITDGWITSCPSPNVDLATQGKYLHRLYMMAAFRLTTRKVSSGSRRKDGHNIGALLVTGDGQIIAGALNVGACPNNTTLHAEVNLLQMYTGVGRTVPAGCFVYTTMKPCNMCAAMLAELAPSCTVIYQQIDPFANGTIAPQGGIRQIDATGAKPLRIYDADGAFSKTGTLGETLTAKRAQRSNTTLTSFVDTPAVLNLMRSTQRGLERKAQRYASGATNRRGEPKRPEVVAVLEHIGRNLGFAVDHPVPTAPQVQATPDAVNIDSVDLGLDDAYWQEVEAAWTNSNNNNNLDDTFWAELEKGWTNSNN